MFVGAKSYFFYWYIKYKVTNIHSFVICQKDIKNMQHSMTVMSAISPTPGPEVIKNFMLHAAEHEIFPVHKC